MKKRTLLVAIAMLIAVSSITSCRTCKAHSGKWDTHRRRG